MPGGFTHNVELLLDAKGRDAFALRFPDFAFAFDDPDLRALFQPIDREAAKAKRRSRIFGGAAVGLIAAALLAWVPGIAFHDQPWFRIVVIVAAVLAVAGLIAGWAGVLTGASRDEWLRQRFLCERIRQLHFQTLVAWAPQIIEAARNKEPAAFLQARRVRTEQFRSQVINASSVLVADLVADRADDHVWLVAADERPAPDDALAVAYFEALQELRLQHQRDFAGLQLLSHWTLRPRSPLQMAKLLSSTGAFCALLLLNLGVAGLALDAATGRPAQLTQAFMIGFAVIALAARTLEEGFQVHSDVSRYRTYDAVLRRLVQQYRQAASNEERRSVLMELEEACFDEMVGFLKSHREARFLM